MANEPGGRPSLVERKLVTILSADVAEYSRLMSEDEERTLLIFQDYSQIFRALVDMHHGRIFNTAGDALLAEFTSPIEAVRCATDIQAALRTRNDPLPPARQVRFRIGVNLGDVMTQGTDLLGDGVNVASRLQGAAEPGGICISGTVYDQIRNKLSLNIEPQGERRFKNIPQPVRTFTIAATDDDDGASPARRKSPAARESRATSAVRSGSSMPAGLLLKGTMAGVALLVLAGGYWAYTAYPRSPAPQSERHPNSNPAIAPITVVTSLDKQAGVLVADAQRVQRPQNEMDSLTASSTQIATLASQLHGLGKKPGDATKARSLVAQMSSLAVEMSHNEATALERAVTQSWRGMERPLSKSIAPDAAAAIEAAQQAKTNIDNAIATAQKAQDGSAALKATGQALADYNAFTAAYDAAAPSYIAIRRNDFAVLATAAHNISENVVALSGGKRPWLLASHARREAYQTLSNNAAEARSQVARLDALSPRAGGAISIGKMDLAVSRAAAIKASLNRLLKSSRAAFIIFNQ